MADEKATAADPTNPGAALDSTRGYHFPVFDFMANYTPEYDAARRNLLSHIYTPKDSELPVKYRELIAAAVLATRHYPSIEAHLRRALREGASMREVIEAMQVAAIPGGSPTLHFALTYLARIAEEGEDGKEGGQSGH